MNLEDYFYVSFESGGRGPEVFDCWGWARSIRYNVYGCKLLPETPGVDIKDIVGMTEVYHSLSGDPEYKITEDISSCEPGTVVGVLVAGMCTHVGVVIEVNNLLHYADITESGIRRMPLDQLPKLFRSRVYTLVYLNDND